MSSLSSVVREGLCLKITIKKTTKLGKKLPTRMSKEECFLRGKSQPKALREQWLVYSSSIKEPVSCSMVSKLGEEGGAASYEPLKTLLKTLNLLADKRTQPV